MTGTRYYAGLLALSALLCPFKTSEAQLGNLTKKL
jgi:hypothetical protein